MGGLLNELMIGEGKLYTELIILEPRSPCIVRIYEPECDLTYDLDGGTSAGAKQIRLHIQLPLWSHRTVKIWGPVKEGFHCTSNGNF